MMELQLIGLAMLAGLLLLGAAAWRAQRRSERLIQQRLTRHVLSAPPAAGAAGQDGTPLPDGWFAMRCFRAELPRRGTLGLLLGSILVNASLAALLLGPLPALAAGAATILGFVATMHLRIAARISRLHDALPVFLDRLRQQLMIGASVPQALQRVVAVSPPIIHWVFEPVERRVNAGGELVETLEWAARRHGHEGLATLAAVVSASLRFGGRLSEAIGNLAQMERRRLQVHQEMHGATSEVRASSVVLGSLPLGVGAYLFVVVPDFAAYFMDPARGLSTLQFIIGLYLLGLFLLRQIAQPRF